MKVPLGVGRINCKLLFLKRTKLSELLILFSRLFYSVTVDGKNEFLKKYVEPITLYLGKSITLNLAMLPILFLLPHAVLVVRILSKRYLGIDFYLS